MNNARYRPAVLTFYDAGVALSLQLGMLARMREGCHWCGLVGDVPSNENRILMGILYEKLIPTDLPKDTMTLMYVSDAMESYWIR